MLVKNIQKPENYNEWIAAKEKQAKLIYRKSENDDIDVVDDNKISSKIDFLFLNAKTNKKLYHKDTAKEEIIKILGSDKYIIPTYQICDNIKDIDWNNLIGKSFVIKPARKADSNGVIIHKKKFKANEIKSFKAQVEQNKYLVDSTVVIEKFIGAKNSKNDFQKDYKFWCFNGKPTLLLVITSRGGGNHSSCFFDMSFKKLQLERRGFDDDQNTKIKKPKNFQTMIEIASKISQNEPVVRVDLYNINGKIFFGECQTIYGFHCKFQNPKDNKTLSKLLDLSNISSDILNKTNRTFQLANNNTAQEAKHILKCNDDNFEIGFTKSKRAMFYKTHDDKYIYKKQNFWYQESYLDEELYNIYNKRTRTFEPLKQKEAGKMLNNISKNRVEYRYDSDGDIVYYNKYNPSVGVKYINGKWKQDNYETIMVKKA